MSHRRLIASAATVTLLGGLVAAPVALAAPAAPVATGRTAAPAKLVGRLAFVTKDNLVKIATVTASGVSGPTKRIGPITIINSGQVVRISDFVASGDGAFVAWNEDVFGNHGKRFVRSSVIDYDAVGNTWHPLENNSAAAAIGFAGDALVVNDGGVTKQLVLQPTEHLVKVKDNQSPIGTYPGGVVDDVFTFHQHHSTRTDALRLTSFGGAHRVLHTYSIGKNQYDDPNQAWSSADGRHLVVERGNHEDFGGLGPSSLADEFALTGSHHRSQLSHFGTARQAWRIASVTYAGKSDDVWTAWYRAVGTGATGVVARYVAGKWKRVAANAIAVAGNPAGYVIVQLGKFVPIRPQEADDFATVPTSHAYLMHGAVTTVLPLSGSAFAWINTSA